MSAQQPDTKPGAYYVTMIDGARVAFLAGPFINDHAGALALVDDVRKLANELDPRSHFYAFGTARKSLWGNPEQRAGKLNGRLGLPVHYQRATAEQMAGVVRSDAPDADENPVTVVLGTYPHFDAAADAARALVAGVRS